MVPCLACVSRVGSFDDPATRYSEVLLTGWVDVLWTASYAWSGEVATGAFTHTRVWHGLASNPRVWLQLDNIQYVKLRFHFSFPNILGYVASW